MAAWVAAARQAGSLSIRSPPSLATQSAKRIQRRGLAGGPSHGPPKVNCWEDPLSPSKWKEEHFVIVSLSAWSVLIYGGYKTFSSGDKKEKKEQSVAEASH